MRKTGKRRRHIAAFLSRSSIRRTTKANAQAQTKLGPIALLEQLHRHVAKLELLNLHGRSHGEFVHEEDAFGNLVARDTRNGVFAHVFFGHALITRTRANERTDDFSELLVGNTHDLGVEDAGHAQKEVLDFQRIDVFAAADASCP